MSDNITIFTRMDAKGFDDFIADPEVVLAVVEDMGFDQEDLSANTDPELLYQLMEGRWSGEERNFSFEKCWDTLTKFCPDNDSLKLIKSGGRNSQIYNEEGPILVLSPEQITRAEPSIASIEIENPGITDEEFALKDLLPALQRFFQLAKEHAQYVLVTEM